MIDFESGDIVFLTKDRAERYMGAPKAQAIRNKLHREPNARVWFRPQGSSVYHLLDYKFNLTGHVRTINDDDLYVNPAAVMAARKRGKSHASVENGKRGGRPKK